jgi:glycosyltransferase involved in cell wall biosynthesis
VRDARIRAEFGVSDGDLLLLYSGNMGLMHAPDPILEAAARVKDIPVRFLFIGDGARRRHLVDRVRREGLDRVTFLPLQPEARFIDIIGASDACFVALRPGLERLAVPCRAYTLLSAGRPLITIMNPQADIARLVAETGCGWNVENAADLSELIRALWRDPERIRAAGRNGRRVYGERFRREALLGSYVRILGQTLPMTESMSR